MPTLILVIPDLYPVEPTAETRAVLPRLPALERLLARARHAPLAAPDWRHWLLARLAPHWQAAGPGAVAAQAAGGGEPGEAHWLATPVHWVAGLDTLRLHADGLLLLDADEQRALVDDFARVFAGSGWRLRSLGRRELVLSGPPAEASSGDPARWLGLPPTDGLPRGPGAGGLRRTGAEIEMWLHQHAVNEAREARGQLPVTGLWMWGNAGRANEAPAQPPSQPAPVASFHLHGADAFVDGLAAVAGMPRSTLPVQPPDPAAGDALVVLGGGESLGREHLEQWERAWFGPLLADFERGRWRALELACGERHWQARRGLGAALAGLRGVRPWWENLLAC